MKIAIGCDPNAADLKNEIIDELTKQGHIIEDFGSDDPIYANVTIAVAEAVVHGDYARGIVMCGTGIGASIAANKVPGAFCALVTNEYQAERAALSNNANLVAFGAQVNTATVTRRMVRIWIEHTNNFDRSGRSAPKVARIAEYAEDHQK